MVENNLFNREKFIRVTENTSPSFDFLAIYEEQAVLEHLYKKFQILKGTYIFDPEYGSNLLLYLFRPLDGETEALIRQEVDSIIREIPVIIKHEIFLERKDNSKEIVVYVTLYFKSGNIHIMELNGENVTSL